MFSSTVYGKDCQVGTSGKGSKVCGPTCAEDAEGPKQLHREDEGLYEPTTLGIVPSTLHPLYRMN